MKLTNRNRSVPAVALWLVALARLATAAPVITAIEPAMGSTNGATNVDLMGSGFVASGTTTVTFGGALATSVEVLAGYGSYYINCRTPPHAEGVVDVTVMNPDASAYTLPNSFTYFEPIPPVIAAIDPAAGSGNGGTDVQITGTGFVASGTTTVTFGGALAMNVQVLGEYGAYSISCLTPPHAGGVVDVTVTNPDGSFYTLPNSFTYFGFTTQPVGGAYYVGESHTFTVVVTGGTPPYDYEWWRYEGTSWQEILGSASSTYPIVYLEVGHSTQYRCVAGDSTPSSPFEATSAPAALTVVEHVDITQDPQDALYYFDNIPAFHTFTVLATGGKGELHYQWRRGGVDILGATSDAYTISPLGTGNAGFYSCQVHDSDGTDYVVSDAAELAFAGPIAISAQPSGGYYYEYEQPSHTLSVTATGGRGAIQYEWRRNNAPISGATAASYVINPLIVSGTGVYTCVLTDSLGSYEIATDDAVVTVVKHVGITAGPLGGGYYVGDAVVLSVEAEGGKGELTYQWQEGGSDLSGVETDTLTLDPIGMGDAGSYTCVVRDADGTDEVISSAADIFVFEHVVVTSDPAGGLYYEHEVPSHTFSVTATGGKGALQYQWQKDLEDISGATSSSYELQPIELDDMGVYTCLVWDSSGTDEVSSGGAVLGVVSHVHVTTPPLGGDYYVGDAVVLTVAADGGKGPLMYQWQKDDEDILGAETDTLDLGAVVPDSAGSYTCVLQDMGGTDEVASAPAVIRVFDHVSVVSEPEGGAFYTDEIPSHTFTVAATGGKGALAYQWMREGEDIAGATWSWYTVAPLETSDTGLYVCVVTDTGGDDVVESETAFLNVVDHLAVTEDPLGGRYYVNELPHHTFAVAASGGKGVLEFQWKKDGDDILGATSDTLTVEPLTLADTAAYSCAINDADGSDLVTSSAAVLTVVNHVAITLNPASVVYYSGEAPTHTFTIAATGGKGALEYRWMKSSVAIPLATGPSFTINPLGPSAVGVYSCAVKDAEGTDHKTSAIAFLTMVSHVFFTVQPSGGVFCEEDAHTLSVVAKGGKGLREYQWKKNGSDVPEAHAATLVFPSLSLADTGVYTCVVSDTEGTDVVPSNEASVTVNVCPDLWILTQPVGGRVYLGYSYSMSIELRNGWPPYHYEWYKDSELIPGANGPTLDFPKLTIEDTGVYTCVVWDEDDEPTVLTSEPADLFVVQRVPLAGPLGLSALAAVSALLGVFAARRKR